MQQALKFLVIFMGVLIFAGLAIVVVTLATRNGNEDTADVSDAAADAGFGTVEAGLPPGSRVVDMATEGDRLVLHVRLPDGGEQILVLDLATGRVLGTIDVDAP